MEARVRNALPFMLIALVLGILFGLLLGWQVWPVTWYNTDPSDLRIEHQTNYVLMAAEAFAQTGNSEQARLRLGQLQDEDTSWEQVANLVERVAREREASGDAANAILIRRMAQSLGMPSPTAAQFEEPRYSIRFSDRPLLAPIVAIGLLALIGIAVWLLLAGARDTGGTSTSPLRVMRKAQAQPSLANVGGYRPRPLAQPVTEEMELLEEAEEPLDMEEAEPPRYISAPEQEAVAEAEAPTAAPTDMPEQEPEESLDVEDLEELEEVEEEEVIARGAPVESEMAADELPPDALGIWEADYAYGNDDFDCNFTIETPDREFLGECGVGASDYVGGEGPQKVHAFEIWLFDKGDIRTVRQILVSEYAYNDAALNAKLAEKGEVTMVQPGAIIPLETQSLAVTATVQEFSYIQDEEKENAYFARLRVELIAERNDQLA